MESVDEEVVLVKEIGSTATIDFPHQRENCGVFPFNKNGSKTNARYCNQCYCYVCDVNAYKCKFWGPDAGDDPEAHCHAHYGGVWRGRLEQTQITGQSQNISENVPPGDNVSTSTGMDPSSGQLQTRLGSSEQATCSYTVIFGPFLSSDLFPSRNTAYCERQDLYQTEQDQMQIQSQTQVHAENDNLEVPNPAHDMRLAPLGTVTLKCKLVQDMPHGIGYHLVPFGFWDVKTEAQAIEMCYNGNLISLWNLHLAFEIENLKDPYQPENDIMDSSEMLLGELRKNSLWGEGGSVDSVPRIFTSLEWTQGATAREGEMSIKIFLWKIGRDECLLGNWQYAYQSCDPIGTVMKWLSLTGSWKEVHEAQLMHTQMLMWQTHVKSPVSEKQCREFLNLMGDDMNAETSIVQPEKMPVELHNYHLHAIQRMFQAESKVTGFAYELWVQLDLDGQAPFWYSPILGQVCIRHIDPQYRGGFLVDSLQGQMHTVLGLILTWPAPICIDKSMRWTKATLIVCRTRDKGAWLSLGKDVREPFIIKEFTDSQEFWDGLQLCDIVVLAYSDVMKAYRTQSENNIFYWEWHRLIFANGNLLARQEVPEMVVGCSCLSSDHRWILDETLMKTGPTSIQPLLAVLGVYPCGDASNFAEMEKEKWRVFYVLSRLIVRHDRKFSYAGVF